MKSEHSKELRLLRELSARLGANPLLVQASTGNTSLKMDGVLWIKASGKWLSQADQDDFLAPVDLEAARAGICESSIGGRCASIETSMHAMLPRRIVVHVHSVNVIAWAVRQDAEKQLTARLEGIPWQWIPYTPSGLPLARRIEQAITRGPETDVLILGNHGLVICADTCTAAEALLEQVEARLRLEPRLPAYSPISALTMDPHSKRILAGGVLYPCQAIFLPGITPSLESIRPRLTRAEAEILNGLAEVVQRIDPAAAIRYLEETEVRSVLSEGAGAYRRTADPDYTAA